MEKGVLVDLTLCIGCRGCQVACKEWNERKATRTYFTGDFTNPAQLSSDCFTNIQFIETKKQGRPAWNFVKNQCLHCKSPACVSACPVNALTKSMKGPVMYNFDKCIKTCPTGTLYFDDYDKIVAEAKIRIMDEPNKYLNHIYGLTEAGGTNWIYLSDIPFKQLGFKENIKAVPLPDITWPVLSTIPGKIAGIAALLSAIAYFRTRGAQEEDTQ
jgi:formate dehydrogenase iron-sulfur subunit